jgi:four helix bundle protein
VIYLSYDSALELEAQILFAGELDLIEKDELGTIKKDITEIERMLGETDKSYRIQTLESLTP